MSLQGEYKSVLDILHTQAAINELKNYFENTFSKSMRLLKVSAPLLVQNGEGINDDLNGYERVLSFDAADIKNKNIEVVQSLAKWKRVALSRYGFAKGTGLYTNMHAIRRDEKLDNLHSIFVDQWDWEKVISKEERNLGTLKQEVRKIYQAIKSTELHMFGLHSQLTPKLPNDIFFITAQELEDMYPYNTTKEREFIIAKKHGAVFIMQIGGVLRSGERHDGRSPDYDDWALNGDMLFWSPLLQTAIEISSMGIRVDEKALLKQLRSSFYEDRKGLPYHKAILEKKLPYTIGGGIGQSRLSMFLLKKAHIGEVQASVWNEKIRTECKKQNIFLL
ncbi:MULTISPECIES: aspartate--ammonia ligase [unclassified Fredinandcohnia]|uniref:aspartate--ammonia ligase n=1 Tax=unclassified Fredinandcohnia TaxID=2837514 RepID=UPI001A9E433E